MSLNSFKEALKPCSASSSAASATDPSSSSTFSVANPSSLTQSPPPARKPPKSSLLQQLQRLDLPDSAKRPPRCLADKIREQEEEQRERDERRPIPPAAPAVREGPSSPFSSQPPAKPPFVHGFGWRASMETVGSGVDLEGSELLLSVAGVEEPSWRLNFNGIQRSEHKEKPPRGLQDCLGLLGPGDVIAEYYQQHVEMLEGFTDHGFLPGTSKEERGKVARSETLAIRLSNIANMILFVAKVLCYLCADDHISDTTKVLQRPVTVFLQPKDAALVRRVEPHSRVSFWSATRRLPADIGVLNACSDQLVLAEGKQVHGYLLKMGFELQLFIKSALVDMFAKCGCVEDARKEFDELQGNDIVIWSSVIAGYV